MSEAKSMVKIMSRQTTKRTAPNRAYLASRRAPCVRGGGADLTPRSRTRRRSGGGGTTGESASRDDGADSQKRSVVETAGKSRGGGGVGGAGGKEAARKKARTNCGRPPRFSLCPASPERLL
jgi:hypothetical protein